MNSVKSKAALLKCFSDAPDDVREYFRFLPALIDGFPLDVALAYLFSRVELAQNMALYCGLAKIHRADSSLAYRAIQNHHMTRGEFRDKYAAIYGKPIPEKVSALMMQAEGVRDRVMHGKGASDDQSRNAIAHVLAYAVELNQLTVTNGGPRPFGDLRGFKGAGQSLERTTTRWVLRGMGFGM